MKTKKPLSQLMLAVPSQEKPVTDFLTASGTFQDGDLLLNKTGLRLISEENSSQPPDVKDMDMQFNTEDFETVKVIGKGSGGVVQLVRQKFLGTLFALKCIQMNIQETVRKQIVQEIKINQASLCPHVVVCYHSFYHNGIISLVLEYMDRGSLADIIRQVKTILEPYLAVLCQQVLKGLVYLHHERHVIHRDIKPSNLLVNHKGEVKITDFGVSAVLASSMGQRDTFVGTYNYMAPERISGGSYDFKSDIWSLGLVILECAIGSFPYRQTENEDGPLSFYELLETIVEEPPPSAPEDQFSPEFCSFISACVQKEPQQRQSSLELLNHPFIRKFEGKDIDLGILVASLDPPIKREISTMKLIKHPNVIRMHEVMASKTKIYIVLEFVTGGELFDKIKARGIMKEDEARRYFQQLINAVDYCHSRGVYHRDLKPENLLLDSNGVLKVSDFGLSALPQQVRGDGLLHTTCGTPNYVAPEVINNKGYDGAKADLWSCGVILFVLMAGYLPFEDSNLMSLYQKIFKADFSCPTWFSTSVKKLIKRILDPNPHTRITIAEVIESEWFKKGYHPPMFETADISVLNVDAIFCSSGEPQNLVVEQKEEGPALMNAFELISTSQGLNLGVLFEKKMDIAKSETRFASKAPAAEILSKIQEAAKQLGFNIEKRNYKLKLKGQKCGRKGPLAIATEVFEVAPSLNMVELRKANGDTLEFHKFYNNITVGLKDIVWHSPKDDNYS